MSFNPKDHYFKKAKKENFAARSVYKLEEIQKRYRILKPGNLILDLGASPGSWSQYATKAVGPKGRVIGLDLKPVSVKIDNFEFVQDDALKINWDEFFASRKLGPFDSVLSDMAPNTTGIRLTDQARSMELCELALTVAEKVVRPGGHFVCKLFHSDDFKILKAKILNSFKTFEAIKPESTRSQSKEIFLVGLIRK